MQTTEMHKKFFENIKSLDLDYGDTLKTQLKNYSLIAVEKNLYQEETSIE
jgi:hypothetical protein